MADTPTPAFRSQTAAASLKRLRGVDLSSANLSFRSQTSAASLKLGCSVPYRVELALFPQPDRCGLIEALGPYVVTFTSLRPFRSQTAAASLKRLLSHYVAFLAAPFRSQTAAASLKPVSPARLPARAICFPQPDRCGLIEALIGDLAKAVKIAFRSQTAAASLKPVRAGPVRLGVDILSAARPLRPH